MVVCECVRVNGKRVEDKYCKPAWFVWLFSMVGKAKGRLKIFDIMPYRIPMTLSAV
ncbi:hypothetical protein [Neisseria weaveri]|uniref:hypothetical protein n=1 Tax=Neisseria weaveri TaxID=28091 RepID=UPI001F415EF5|nr:hypothetical protein [Neisseria weaveri]